MNKKASAYPLHWPEGWSRSKRPSKSQFKTSLSGSLNNVNKSLEMFAKDSGHKIENVLISSNVTLGQQRPNDAGVAVYFSWDGISTCIAVDRYATCEENLQAIHHCIEAERVKLRHGGINLVRAAFRGYAALPPGTGGRSVEDWRKVFDVTEAIHNSTGALAHVEKRYKQLAAKYHPDKPGGDPVEFDWITKCRDWARKDLSK